MQILNVTIVPDIERRIQRRHRKIGLGAALLADDAGGRNKVEVKGKGPCMALLPALPKIATLYLTRHGHKASIRKKFH